MLEKGKFIKHSPCQTFPLYSILYLPKLYLCTFCVYIGNSYVVFNNNSAHHHGGSIYSINSSHIFFQRDSSVVFKSNIADIGGAVYSYHSNIYFQENSVTAFNDNFANNDGGAVYSIYGHISFEQNSSTSFRNNLAKESSGAAIYSKYHNIYFKKHSSATFSNNIARYFGGAIYSENAYIYFEENSSTVFKNNHANFYGGSTYSRKGYMFFAENSFTEFSNNYAYNGGAIFSSYGDVTFAHKSSTLFMNNNAVEGGAIGNYVGDLMFNGNSSTMFKNNAAKKIGGAMYCYSCHIYFKQNSSTIFSNNIANVGGAVYSNANSLMYFEQNSYTMFKNNAAKKTGGVMYCYSCHIYFKENSSAIFSNNNANVGGAIYSTAKGHMQFEQNSYTMFSYNTAGEGGAIYMSTITDKNMSLHGNSFTVFSNNIAATGGALSLRCDIYFKQNSKIDFTNNTAKEGGAIFIFHSNSISFKGNSKGIFRNNTASSGGSIHSSSGSIHFEGVSKTEFSLNSAVDGGAIFTGANISFEGNSYTIFNNNNAENDGGAIFTIEKGILVFNGYSTTVFKNNKADYGGALFAKLNSNITFSDDSTITFTDNMATFGTTIYSTSKSNIIAEQNSTVIFDNISAQWCNDSCLHYTGQEDTVVIDKNGTVWCSNQKQFICLMSKCSCNKLEDSLNTHILQHTNIVKITGKEWILSSAIKIDLVTNVTPYQRNISIIGHNNPTVICVSGGRLELRHHYYLIIEGIIWIGCGGYSDILTPVILFEFHTSNQNDYTITIQNCSFQHSIAPAVAYFQNKENMNITINHCNFINGSHHRGQGVAIYYASLYGKVTINNCNFSYNGFAKSIIYVKSFAKVYINNSNFYSNQGVSVYLSKYSILHIHGKVLFENNIAENGAAIYISDHSTIVFDKNSIVKCNKNNASNGTIYSVASSNVIFKENCEVTFSNNSATQYGAAIYSVDNSHVTFTENSKVKFIYNIIPISVKKQQLGGIIYSDSYSYLSFEDNSITVFSSNIADFGAAIYSLCNSNITFKHNSLVKFINNIARSCGTLTSALYSTITFNDNTKVTFSVNTVSCTSNPYDEFLASAICSFKSTDVIFSGHSFITFFNNTAHSGGAVVIFESNIYVEEYSTVNFNSNIALYSSGGAFQCSNNSNITIQGNSSVIFNNNMAGKHGGAIYSCDICKIAFRGYSTSKFVNNNAVYYGGATLGSQLSTMIFEGNSAVTFDHNSADNGGVFYFNNSTIIFKEKSIVSFSNNKARQSGGVGYFSLHTKVKFEGITAARFDNNKAFYGGAILVTDHSNITLIENSVLSFVSNEATQNGGAGHFYNNCNFVIQENAMVMFDNNEALYGGALCVSDKTNIVIKGRSTALFNSNVATISGGAIEVVNKSSLSLRDDMYINFTINSAQYGGAIFLDKSAVIINNSNNVFFKNNKAKFKGNSMYLDITEPCNSSCSNSKTMNINSEFIITSISVLKFYDPAICIDNDNGTQCNSYYAQNIMLGREIIIPTCVLDCYNKVIIHSTQLIIYADINSNYFINGTQDILKSCDLFHGLRVMGNQTLTTLKNFSINISLNLDHNADWKQITIALVIELSPCYPGFWHYPESQQCECYNSNDIVFCSDNSSTIKSGYWFGNVTGRPTVTFCPINYCNFTCCETTNGYYQLSPVRDNQCRSYRSGAACGGCKYGYTLSFDSTECVSLESCTVGQTVLVIMLTVIYWIVMFVVVFVISYYRIGIEYFYCITYYYSIVDILLSQNLQANGGLYLVVSIISSFSKITPQFLGKLCLTPGMSGIDQQFVHYIHPPAPIIILVTIIIFTWKSERIGIIISRGVSHIICLLLLLSYTSVASTSLLLIRSLRFNEIDKIYSYLSPDIEYFHDRHLVYGIVALLCIVSIVIGLPLLLTIHPFINHKINLVKIKPLLDQFQGCYKDNYRYFAAYYMICRLVIITIVIVNSSNDFVATYMLTFISGVIALIHQIMKPYNNKILNKFDGVTLQLIIFITVLSLFSDDFNSPLAIILVYVLIFFPLLCLITIALFKNRDYFKKLIKHFVFKDRSLNTNNEINNNGTSINDVINNDIHMREFENIIDGRRRLNVTECIM